MDENETNPSNSYESEHWWTSS